MGWDETASASVATGLFDGTLTAGQSTPLLGVDTFASLALWARFAAGAAGARGALQLTWSDPNGSAGAATGGPFASYDPAWSTTETSLYSVPVTAPALTIKNTGAVSAVLTVSGKSLQVPRFIQRGDDTGSRQLSASSAGTTPVTLTAGTGSPVTRFTGLCSLNVLLTVTTNTGGALDGTYIDGAGNPQTIRTTVAAGTAAQLFSFYHPAVPVRWSWTSGTTSAQTVTLTVSQA